DIPGKRHVSGLSDLAAINFLETAPSAQGGAFPQAPHPSPNALFQRQVFFKGYVLPAFSICLK
ncbi:hypothetical protein, partial [uncultured Desulfovibrio sp.]|uniref:hypothetical protein n=1 Tax=uncultured Desulfovibrio sp. TaxID=167968 RepID=UPI00262E2BC6